MVDDVLMRPSALVWFQQKAEAAREMLVCCFCRESGVASGGLSRGRRDSSLSCASGSQINRELGLSNSSRFFNSNPCSDSNMRFFLIAGIVVYATSRT